MISIVHGRAHHVSFLSWKLRYALFIKYLIEA